MKPLPAGIVEAVLDTAPVGRLALSDEQDRPEALPIVFARAAGCLWSPIDGKPKSTAQLARLARLARAPEVMLLVDHYADDWADLWWLRLRARAEIVADKHPDWSVAVEALDAKYPQYGPTPMFSGEPTLIRLSWHALSWWAWSGKEGILRWLEREAPDGAP